MSHQSYQPHPFGMMPGLQPNNYFGMPHRHPPHFTMQQSIQPVQEHTNLSEEFDNRDFPKIGSFEDMLQAETPLATDALDPCVQHLPPVTSLNGQNGATGFMEVGPVDQIMLEPSMAACTTVPVVNDLELGTTMSAPLSTHSLPPDPTSATALSTNAVVGPIRAEPQDVDVKKEDREICIFISD